jgi:hypothetical protein
VLGGELQPRRLIADAAGDYRAIGRPVTFQNNGTVIDGASVTDKAQTLVVDHLA